ncbi:hypothetical protein [Streptococcus agalactiae]|uniref:Phage membrane protein n=1 Tax=Streptococcus agalactiae TaxID=1311 RepID=A0A7Z7P4N8_STRAG|nr:hypothetical protein [Streptococcus agalactiae]SQA20091.1 phage membrane protein [Streptococcus agalactiae]
MNYDKNKNDAKKNFIIALVLLPFGLVLSGFVIKYGWNNILSTIDGVPSINLPQAVVINVLISPFASKKNTDEDFCYSDCKSVYFSVVVLLLLWIVTLFM